MTGPASPGSEGPTFAPPPLPAGWIAQWDGNSKKYYFVQLSTGVSQWDTPTDPAPVGGTPATAIEHPYGVPGQPQLITHPDGSQTVKHPDGTMEPVMPEGARGVEGGGPTGERGFGTMAMNALLNSGKQNSGSGQNSSGGNMGGLANVLGSFTHSSGSSGGHAGSSNSNGLGGKLVGQLASNLFSSGNKPAQPQAYHSGQAQQSHSGGGIAGAVMGGVANMFGGSSHGSSNQNYGYSNSGQTGGYSGTAPPTTYQPGSSQHTPAPQTPHGSQAQSHNATPTYFSPTQNQPQSFPPPPGQAHAGSYSQAPTGQHGTPSFAPPPNQYGGQHGQQNPYGQPQHNQYGQHGQHGQIPQQGGGHAADYHGAPATSQHGYQHQQPSYGGQGGGYTASYAAGGAPLGQYPGQQSYGNQGPAVPHGSHPYGSNPQY